MKKILIICFLMLYSGVTFAINYDSIDHHADRAPVLKDRSKLNELVQWLIKPYKKEEEKARVLLAWIVSHIDYNEYVYQKIIEYAEQQQRCFKIRDPEDIPEHDILEIRAGVCGDIAQLYKEMGDFAGIDIRVVHGTTSNCSFEETQYGRCAHAWNVVQIDGKWEYVDPTWAMGQAKALGENHSLRQYEKAVDRRINSKRNLKARSDRAINNRWFLTDKEVMIQTHFPDDPQWQLQKKKITETEFFDIGKSTYKTVLNRIKRKQKRAEDSENYKMRQRLKALER